MQVTLVPGQTLTVVCEAAPLPAPAPQPVPAPPGETLIFSDDLWTDLSKWDWKTKAAQIVTMLQSAGGGKSLLVDQSLYGWGGEMLKFLPPMRRVRLELEWLIPGTFDMSFKPGRHFFRLSDRGGSQGFGHEINHEISGSSGAIQAQVFWPNENNFGGIRVLPRDRWFKFSVFVNLDGGIAEFTIDGTRYTYTFAPAADKAPIESLRLVTNYDGAPAPGKTGGFYYRNVRVYQIT